MIYKLDHVGITVQSLAEARGQIEEGHPCFHTQYGIEAREALREVSIHKPKQLDISLHKKKDNISIELIEYPKVSKKQGSILPWGCDPDDPAGSLHGLKDALRSADGFSGIASLLAAHPVFNAVVIPVQDLSAEERFWEALRFRKVHSDEEAVILSLKSLVPPGENGYVVLYKVDCAAQYHTDLEGINEIALLCSSCSGDLEAFPQDVFKSSADRLLVDGKEIELGYLRSPSGVLAELFSVRLAVHEQR